MRKSLPYLLLLLMLPLATLAQSDSLTADKWISRARAMLGINAIEARPILDSLKDFLRTRPQMRFQLAEWNKQMGVYHFRQTNNDSANHYYSRAHAIYKELKRPVDAAKIRVNMSMVYNRQAKWDTTILYAREALRTFEDSNDVRGISLASNMIGQVFFGNKDYPKAITYFRKYLANAFQINDSTEIGSGYNNLGSAFFYLEDYDSSLHYSRLALAVANRTRNEYSLGNSKLNMASTLERMNQINEALPLYDEAIIHFQRTNNRSGLLRASINFGKLLITLKRYREAVPHLKTGLDLTRQFGEKEVEITALTSLADALDSLGQYKDAAKYYHEAYVLRDSLLSAEHRAVVEDINTKYETEKKDRLIAENDRQRAIQDATIAQNEATIAQNRFWITSLIAAFLLVGAVFLIWFFVMRAQKSAMAAAKERELREVRLRAIVESQENERKRFAADLHDNIGQLISALQLNLRNMRKQTTGPAEALLDNSGHLLGDLHTEIRNTIFQLMPPILDREGLVPAITELSSRITGTGGLKMEFSAFGLEGRLLENAEIALYRVTQEWTSNVVKYAQANSLFVQLVAHEDEIVLSFEDDGQGFSPAALQAGKGNGWKNISTRLDMIGGRLDLDTAPDRQGTTLMLTIPLHGLLRQPTSTLAAPSVISTGTFGAGAPNA